jgi:hypothetical protein
MTKGERPGGEALAHSVAEEHVQHVIIYMKVIEDKEKGIIFNGPWYGSVCRSHDMAAEEAKNLTNKTKNGAAITKIIAIGDSESWSSAMNIAKPMFDRICNDIREAKQIVDRPIIKKKKKKKT